MKSSEMCLLATRGKPHYLLKKRNVRQLIESKRREHSQKPSEARKRIDEMFGDIRKIELFGRKKIKGWKVIGNHFDGKDIRQEIKEIIEEK